MAKKVLTSHEFYQRANLRENPFRSNPVHGNDPRMNMWVGYEKQKSQLMKFLTRSRADQVGNINFVMIYGNYGVGKSHALLWAGHQIMHSRRDEFDALCYHIPTLKKDKGKLSFAAAFTDDLVVRGNLKRDVLEFRRFLEIIIVRYRDANKVGAKVSADEVIDVILTPGELNSLAKEIHRRESEDSLSEILTPRAMTDYQATTIFNRLVNLFVYPFEINGEARRFKKAVYLMIDELDDLLRASAKEAREVNDMLRHIYDGCPTCFGLVIALTAESATFSAIFEVYILERIQRQILLEQLGKDDALEFVREMLDAPAVRIKADAVKKDFYPFEEAAVEAIVSNLNQITPRKVINTMQQVLEEVRLTGFDPDRSKVDIGFLDEHEIVEEVLGEGGVT